MPAPGDLRGDRTCTEAQSPRRRHALGSLHNAHDLIPAELVDLPFGACRFLTPPKALMTASKVDYLTMTIDRQGLAVRVMGVERTIVDVLHRPELAGGVEEVLKSLDLVRYLDPAKIADYVELLGNRSIASVSGWWLEKRRGALGVTDDVLARLRTRLTTFEALRARRRTWSCRTRRTVARAPPSAGRRCCI